MQVFLPVLNIFIVKSGVMHNVVNFTQSRISWEGSVREDLCGLCWPVNMTMGHFPDYIHWGTKHQATAGSNVLQAGNSGIQKKSKCSWLLLQEQYITIVHMCRCLKLQMKQSRNVINCLSRWIVD